MQSSMSSHTRRCLRRLQPPPQVSNVKNWQGVEAHRRSCTPPNACIRRCCPNPSESTSASPKTKASSGSRQFNVAIGIPVENILIHLALWKVTRPIVVCAAGLKLVRLICAPHGLFVVTNAVAIDVRSTSTATYAKNIQLVPSAIT